jgi:radical SAM modification target selenobiotic family peptide
MTRKELKTILAGLSVATLLAGTGAIGVGYVDAQGG